MTDLEGYEYAFEKVGATYVTPPEMSGWVLTHAMSSLTFTLAGPGGDSTVFENSGGGNEYLPVSASQAGVGDTQLVYQLVEGNRRLSMVIAPPAPGFTCTQENLTKPTAVGCKGLVFQYKPASFWGAPASYGDRLVSITYYGAFERFGNSSWEVAQYKYDSAGRLIAEWDPRISPALTETYSYVGAGSETPLGGQLKTITPPGQESWTLEYSALPGEPQTAGRLKAAKRASLLPSPSQAQTTIVYGVPVCCGSGAPYGAGSSSPAQWVGQWGQQDIPTDATAVFPPSEVPGNPPSAYSGATVYYMDAEGMQVNVATPAGAGTSSPSITTTETDEYGNVIRELSAQNRLLALAAGSGSVVRSHELETKREFSAEGTQLSQEWGPMHKVQLESGATVQAQLHKTIQYNDNWPETGVNPHLPTRVTTGAKIPKEGKDADQRVTEMKYDWNLRKPTETITDPSGLNLHSRTAYNSAGQVIERSLPGKPEGGDAHTTKFIYYSVETQSGDSDCYLGGGYTGQLCKVKPAAQPGTAGQPELLVTRYLAYNQLSQPTEISESPGGGASNVRKTIMAYDTAGRSTSSKQIGGGKELPPSATVYSTTTGLPVERKFTCQEKCEGFDSQANVVEYDALGRPIQYTDADGNTSKTTYDLLGRVATVYDGRATQIYRYDSTSGLLTRLEDPAAGAFTAAYDADGNLTEEKLPNGLVAKTAYDEAGSPTALSYVKTSCSEKCTWLDESNQRSIYGQILSQANLESSQQYSYDKAGRLILVKDTPQGGSCTTRQYFFDADSNRTKLTTRAPGTGPCDTSSEGTSQTYTYDAADRLTGEVTYDSFGRITSLPGKYAGGSTLTSSFYSNEMIATQTQGSITNNYELDSTGRVRRRVQKGGSESTEIFHYAMASDSTAWTYNATSSTWSRNISGIGGGLVAIQPSAGEISLQLANLHGDIVATASLSPTAKAPTANFEFDEFGNPKKGSAGRYGWLGGPKRRTELPSGVIQMGVRSYIPAMGRFISVDPIIGGSANAYDYANADSVNGLDLDGRKSCGLTLKVSSRRHRIWANWNWGCSVSGWRSPLTINKRIVKFERHTKGIKDELLHGKFETKKIEEDRTPNGISKNGRRLEESSSWRCGDLDRTYQIVVEVWVTLQMIGFEPKLVKYSESAQATCQR